MWRSLQNDNGFRFRLYALRNTVQLTETTAKAEQMIYFVQGQRTQLVKIGYSTNKDTFKKRLSQLQCQNADTLVVLRTMAGGRLTESALHLKHKGARVQGEWFKFSASLKRDIASKKIDVEKYKNRVRR